LHGIIVHKNGENMSSMYPQCTPTHIFYLRLYRTCQTSHSTSIQ